MNNLAETPRYFTNTIVSNPEKLKSPRGGIFGALQRPILREIREIREIRKIPTARPAGGFGCSDFQAGEDFGFLGTFRNFRFQKCSF